MIVRWLVSASLLLASCSMSPHTFMAHAESGEGDETEVSYGVDVSWPTHQHHLLETPWQQQASDETTSGVESSSNFRLEAYQEFMDGCYEQYSMDTCESNEYDRVAMNVRQPPTMTNYTYAGYAKLRIPSESYQLLQDVWKHRDTAKREYWDEGNSFTNHWSSPTSYLALDRFLTIQQRRTVLRQVQEILERWTQTRLIPTSLYGVRIYTEGAVLAPHVDRVPLVISAILNVAQEVVEPWPLEVIGHDGVAVNVTMRPGEMILYESASVIHGRPFPLKGTHFANLFVHFAPEQFFQQLEQQEQQEREKPERSARSLYEQALAQQRAVGDSPSRKKAELILPHYLHEDTVINKERWRQDFVFVRERTAPKSEKAQPHKVKGVTSAHVVAANGNLELLKEVEKQYPESLFAADANGWKPLHEAARAGRTDVVEYLLEKGADVNERTNNKRGATPLWWAEHALPENHPTIQLLRQHGGAAIGPND